MYAGDYYFAFVINVFPFIYVSNFIIFLNLCQTRRKPFYGMIYTMNYFFTFVINVSPSAIFLNCCHTL